MCDPVRKKEKFLIFGSPEIGEEEIGEVVSTLRSGWIGTGPKVAAFEEMFRVYCGSDHAIALNSCTAALHLSLLALKLEPGAEVITTPLTFCATINAIIHAGLVPVLADVDYSTMNIDPEQIEAKITPKTRAIIPVHFAGRPCQMDLIMELAEKHNLYVVEDCAHAVESRYKGKKTGTFGRFGCFSFYVTKNMTTGEGGMVLAQKGEDAAWIKMLALHGMSADAWKRFGDEGYKHYYVVESGFKYNMMDIQASIGIRPMNRLEKNWKRRKEIWDQYDNAFSEIEVIVPEKPAKDTRHGYHLYTILIDRDKCGVSRDEFVKRMTYHNIGVGVHYLSLPEHPFYQRQFGWNPQDYPNASIIGRQTVSLPLSAKLTDRDVLDVIKGVKYSIGA